MSTDVRKLDRLLALARRARAMPVPGGQADELMQAPPGLATRVVARWAASSRGPAAALLWERMSWWGTGLAGATCLVVVAFHHPLPEPTGFDLLLRATPSLSPF